MVTRARGCDCVEKVNEQLEDSNCRLVCGHALNLNTREFRLTGPQLKTEKIDTKQRKKLPVVNCVYCPFCGERL